MPALIAFDFGFQGRRCIRSQEDDPLLVTLAIPNPQGFFLEVNLFHANAREFATA